MRRRRPALHELIATVLISSTGLLCMHTPVSVGDLSCIYGAVQLMLVSPWLVGREVQSSSTAASDQ